MKWIYHFICGVLFLYILFVLLFPARHSAFARHARVGTLYTAISGYIIIIWILYALVWSLGDGFRTFTVDTEIVLFAIVYLPFTVMALISARYSG
jgi:bacteriorhodopsin